MHMQTAALYIGIHGVLLVGLALRVALLRRKNKVGIGYGESHDLRRAIRVHANAAENLPYAMILLAACEMLDVRALFIHVFGIAILVGRLLHVAGLSRHPGVSLGRFYGVSITWLTMVFMAAVVVVHSLQG